MRHPLTDDKRAALIETLHATVTTPARGRFFADPGTLGWQPGAAESLPVSLRLGSLLWAATKYRPRSVGALQTAAPDRSEHRHPRAPSVRVQTKYAGTTRAGIRAISRSSGRRSGQRGSKTSGRRVRACPHRVGYGARRPIGTTDVDTTDLIKCLSTRSCAGFRPDSRPHRTTHLLLLPAPLLRLPHSPLLIDGPENMRLRIGDGSAPPLSTSPAAEIGPTYRQL